MAETLPATSPQCLILQVPKAAAELTWVEQAHGVESLMTIVALIVGAVWAVFGDWRKTKGERDAERGLRERERQQREDQLSQQRLKLNWDQTQIARQINEQFLDDSEAQQALALLDCDTDTCTLTDDSEKNAVKKYDLDVKGKEDVRAMRITAPAPTEKEVFVRDCFDAWFYWMAVMEQYLQNGLIRQVDIAYPSEYYVRCLREDQGLFDACLLYIEKYRLSPTIVAFIERFAERPAQPAPVAIN